MATCLNDMVTCSLTAVCGTCGSGRASGRRWKVMDSLRVGCHCTEALQDAQERAAVAALEFLQAERKQFAEERDRLRNKLRGEELVIEARKVKDELIRLRRAQEQNQRQHLGLKAMPRKRRSRCSAQSSEMVTSLHTLLPHTSLHASLPTSLRFTYINSLRSSEEGMCAFAIGTARDWLFRCREMLESQSFAPAGASLSSTAAMTEQSETKLKLRRSKAYALGPVSW
eukprot:Skav209530  [mRNA]  locus=scaffold2767:445323:448037:- [translate_table: standard]